MFPAVVLALLLLAPLPLAAAADDDLTVVSAPALSGRGRLVGAGLLALVGLWGRRLVAKR